MFEDIMFEVTGKDWENEEEKIEFIKTSKFSHEQIVKYIKDIYNSNLYNYVKIKELQPILKYSTYFKLTDVDIEELDAKILLLKLYISKEEQEWLSK